MINRAGRTTKLVIGTICPNLDPFCFKNFKSENENGAIDYDMEKFEIKINELFSEENLKPGYAPFCKHLFIKNFTEAKDLYLEITEENSSKLK